MYILTDMAMEEQTDLDLVVCKRGGNPASLFYNEHVSSGLLE